MAHILIVDDSEEERLLLRAALEPQGHDFLFAANGRVAKEVLERQPVDVIITDLAMPEINGLRLIRELREEGCVLPIVAISGVSPEQLDLAAEYGAGALLVKPVDREELTEAVNRCLEQPRRRIWDVRSRSD